MSEIREPYVISYGLLAGIIVAVGTLLLVGHLRTSSTMRRALMTHGKGILKLSYAEYLRTGSITNATNSFYEVWIRTNVVNVNGTEYQCCIATHLSGYGDGVLGMTTNSTFIWIQPGWAPFVVGSDYRPRFLAPGF